MFILLVLLEIIDEVFYQKLSLTMLFSTVRHLMVLVKINFLLSG